MLSKSSPSLSSIFLFVLGYPIGLKLKIFPENMKVWSGCIIISSKQAMQGSSCDYTEIIFHDGKWLLLSRVLVIEFEA